MTQEQRVRSADADPTKGAGVPYDFNEPPADCPECGYPLGEFSCRIRHIHMNTGACKAAND